MARTACPTAPGPYGDDPRGHGWPRPPRPRRHRARPVFVGLNPDFEVPVEGLAAWLARLDDEDDE
ncbi:DUF6104 family protein [Streptomyces sp. NPDC100445]|uniref:DUF6104 family protein n=1 Tax=Streptomyces sp. NPDC100445 TaxID=3366102 RepID=UPI00380A1DD2